MRERLGHLRAHMIEVFEFSVGLFLRQLSVCNGISEVCGDIYRFLCFLIFLMPPGSAHGQCSWAVIPGSAPRQCPQAMPPGSAPGSATSIVNCPLSILTIQIVIVNVKKATNVVASHVRFLFIGFLPFFSDSYHDITVIRYC